MTILTYKGYTGVIDLDVDEGILHGEVVDLKDTITFQGETIPEMKKAFHDSVDDYLDFCASEGVQPEKPFSGNFMLRVGPRRHKFINKAALHSGESINVWASKKLMEAALDELEEVERHEKNDLEKV
ncbi:type II toxin-antitoxin system HicB family antitoxin [Alkalicoccus luteus]|uniref:Type II toxin-antitoxin system HicB family antitoxin n=1 Tax=Alkalicoccus luteus TaxID=1237094 RepID=A0A969PXK4_9BACI|nr:type II toxin-antitoxin system HicB family antitoxin [Alkalicoccus luteus]NJP37457.1 type II toxin-antitoxin system HicB family antitoxin [Alkalicoccus luteus]